MMSAMRLVVSWVVSLGVTLAVLVVPGIAGAQEVDDEKPPMLGPSAETASAVDDEKPPMFDPPAETTTIEAPAPRPWAASVFLGYSPTGMLGIDVERRVAGPFFVAVAGGLWPRAEYETWTAHGGASLRTRFFGDAPLH